MSILILAFRACRRKNMPPAYRIGRGEPSLSPPPPACLYSPVIPVLVPALSVESALVSRRFLPPEFKQRFKLKSVRAR